MAGSDKFVEQLVRLSVFVNEHPDARRADGSGVLLVPAKKNRSVATPRRRCEPSQKCGTLPRLTSAVEVHRLKREEAQRGYPVNLRGVVNVCGCPSNQAFTLQIRTRGLYVVDLRKLASPPGVW